VPPSILDGRALATTYEYDDAGRLVRSVQEPAWTDRDRALMLALVYYRNTRCPNCGGDPAECGPDSRGKWEVPPPRRCYRTDRLALAQESSKADRPEALSWTVQRRGVANGADSQSEPRAGGRRLSAGR